MAERSARRRGNCDAGRFSEWSAPGWVSPPRDRSTSHCGAPTCGTYICVATAYQGRDFVQDITVTTRDGLPGTLRAFVGDYRGSKANVSRWRFVVNREIRAYPRLA
ncbi:hypothetical protein ABZV63_34465, partial [Streptomyces sp. NPDC004783]